METTTKQFVRQGDVVTHTMPYSEVCMYMKVAGQVRPVLILSNMAQIMNHNGTQFSAPVTFGEAGIYTDSATGLHYVPSHSVVAYKPRPQSTVILYVSRKTGDRVTQCTTENMVEACLERFGRAYEVDIEQDALGRRYRVICPANASALLNPSPAERLARLARSMHIPVALED